MKENKISSFNRIVESVSVLAIILLSVVIINLKVSAETKILPVVLMCFIYGILTLVNIVTYSKSSIDKSNSKNSPLMGEQIKIDDEQKEDFIKKSVFYFSVFKLMITILIPVLVIVNYINSVSYLIYITFLIYLPSALFLVFYSAYYFLLAKGYQFKDYKEFLRKGLIYNNPDDKRVMVDKPFGTGTTVNFGSKEGRRIFYIIISIPVFITLAIILSVALSK